MLGVKRLPRDGMAERLIQGIRVYVAPLVPGWGKRHQPGSSMRTKCWQGLRVTAICDCGRHITVSRLHQHKCDPIALNDNAPQTKEIAEVLALVE